ncbi:hypothetical protein Hesp01_41660 [Herbidospora sp. NBRC 101105]|nr:hypothetical protein Hesp01_41660 [Herbidospora sp. NBRC 101105]
MTPHDVDCPGISPHVAPLAADRVALAWEAQSRGPYRVLDYTCSCLAVYYELVQVGGLQQIHKVIQSEPEQHMFTEAWRAEKARYWWRLLLMGGAR